MTKITTEIMEPLVTLSQRNKKDTLSHKEKLVIHDNSYQLKTLKTSARMNRNCYLKFLSAIWHHCNFITLEENEGEIYSTVKNISVQDIIEQLSQSIFKCLCCNYNEINNIPTISYERTLKIKFINNN